MVVSSNEVLLVRHGETDDNAADRFQGRIDTPLNDRGREQSRVLAAQLAGAGLRALYASPPSRARETEVIAGAADAFAAWQTADSGFRLSGGESLVVCHGATIRAAGRLGGPRTRSPGGSQGTGGEVLDCELRRLPLPAASIT